MTRRRAYLLIGLLAAVLAAWMALNLVLTPYPIWPWDVAAGVARSIVRPVWASLTGQPLSRDLFPGDGTSWIYGGIGVLTGTLVGSLVRRDPAGQVGTRMGLSALGVVVAIVATLILGGLYTASRFSPLDRLPG